jgi:hypothetical protein
MTQELHNELAWDIRKLMQASNQTKISILGHSTGQCRKLLEITICEKQHEKAGTKSKKLFHIYLQR